MRRVCRRKQVQMMKKSARRFLSVLLALAMILSHADLGFAQDSGSDAPAEAPEEAAEGSVELEMEDLDPSALGIKKLGETEEEESDPEGLTPDSSLEETVRVSIFLEGKSTVDAGYPMKGIGTNRSAISYREALKVKQADMTAQIEAVLGHTLDVKWNLTLLTNAISAYVKVREIPFIERLDGVISVKRETRYEAPVDEGGDSPQTANTSENMVGATAAWAAGYTGAGSRIAIIDTGIDTAHQSFNADAFNYAIQEAGASSELMTSAQVQALKSQLNSGTANYVSAKIPYGYNYVDRNTTVNHQSDTAGNHGSHVAGIAAANRYIKSGSSYNNASTAVGAVGMAPDAQLFIMKVFGSNGGAYDSDYFVAIEDAIVLDCDSVNLSLGSAYPGWSFDSAYQDILNNLVNKSHNEGTVVSISAGNSYDAAYFTSSKNLYNGDVNFHTGGSPGSFVNSLTVAAAQNTLIEGAPLMFNGSQQVFYTEDFEDGEGNSYTNPAMTSISGSYSYVYIDALGEASDYSAVNSAVSLSGKIVIVNRGDISFSEKGNNAKTYSPRAVIVANNSGGTIHMNLSDYTGTFPMVAITLKDANRIKANSTVGTTGGITYYTGSVQVTTATVTEVTDRAEAEITDFSSWGVPGSLIMKPEITAPGGDIYSVYGTAKTSSGTEGGTTSYVSYSGTSMAAPHVTGLAAVVAEYLRESKLDTASGLYNTELTDNYSTRAIIQSLLMSTATPMAPDGEYLPVLQQGAGLADVSLAVTSPSVVMISNEGKNLSVNTGANADGKVKAELGDDPEKTGEYSFGLTVYNLTDETLVYELDTDLFTQKLSGEFLTRGTTLLPAGGVTYEWNGETPVIIEESHDVDKDGDTDDDDAQAILNYITGKLDGEEDNYDFSVADMDGDEEITSYDAYLLLNWEPETVPPEEGYAVAPHSSADVIVTVTLTAAQREALAAHKNGAYLEGYFYLSCKGSTKEGVSLVHEHSIPILGFYGSWTDPSMFDNMSYVDELYGEDRLPYSGKTDTNYLQVTYNGTATKFAGNPYTTEEEFPADRLALNTSSTLVRIAYNLIRSAGTTGFAVTKLDGEGRVTEVAASSVYKNDALSQWYYVNQSAWQNTGTQTYTINKSLGTYGLSEGDRFRVGFYAVPEYYAMVLKESYNAYDSGVLGLSGFNTLLEQNELGRGAFVGYDFTVDNTAPSITNAALSGSSLVVTASDNLNLAYVAVMSLDGSLKYFEAVPASKSFSMSVDVADAVANAPGYVAVFAGDYAGNEVAKAVKVNNNGSTDPSAVTGISLTPTSLDLYKGAAADLAAEVEPVTASDRTVTWSSNKTSVATVDANGHVTAVAAGTATITATANGDTSKKATCTVKVTSISKTLNGIVWDEEGGVYFSSFKTDSESSLQGYTKLHNSSQGLDLHAAFYQSKLYAATLDASAQSSTLYTVNTGNYTLTKVDDMAYMASDIAPGPTSYASQYGIMVHPYGYYLLAGTVTDPSGGVYGAGDLSASLGDNVFIAGVAAKSLSSTSANYYFLDENGIIWQVSMSGVTFGTPSKVVETGISTSFLYQSLYYDGTYLYWPHQDGETSEMIIIDPSSKTVYHAGTFGEGVWPVVGLYVNGSVAPASADDGGEESIPELHFLEEDLTTPEIQARYAAEAERFSAKQVKAVEEETTEAETEEVPAEIEAEEAPAEAEDTEAPAEDPAFTGSLNLIRVSSGPAKAAGGTADLNAANVDEDASEPGRVTVVLYEEEASHNGLYAVAYDPSVMALESMESALSFTSVFDDMTSDKGILTFAFADRTAVPAGEPVAVLVFTVGSCEDAELEVMTLERNDELALDESDLLAAPGTGHSWAEPSYRWAADCSSVTAVRTCLLCGAKETETANSTCEETLPTCTEAGSVTYTAVFENEAFETQTKTVDGAPATGHDWIFNGFSWTGNDADGYTAVAANYTCANDGSHKDAVEAELHVETVDPTPGTDGSITYTASVTAAASLDGKAHEDRRTVVLPALGITYEINKTSTQIAVNDSEQLRLVGNDGSFGTAVWTSSNETVAAVDENGLVTAHKYGKATIHAAMADGYEADCEVQTLFWDVADSSKYYFTAVYWGADHDPVITKGYDLKYFGVGEGCTRKDFILFLYRLAGQPTVSKADINAMKEAFSDMTNSELSNSFIKAIAWGYSASDPSKRIINGYNDSYGPELAGTFGPERTITRKEAILMIWRYDGRPDSESTARFEAFDEIVNNKIKPKQDAYKAIRWAAATGLSNGYERPDQLPEGVDIPTPCYGADLTCLREDMIVFLYRYAQKFLGE